MEQFNFNVDWEFEMDLKEFIKSNSMWRENLDSEKLGNLAVQNVKIYTQKMMLTG